MSEIIRVEPVDPFDHTRLYGREKYDLQGMLIRQVDMPHEIHLPGDQTWEVWSDRAGDRIRSAWAEIAKPSSTEKGGGDACNWHRHCPAAEFLRYLQVIVGSEMPITGGRMVRYTDAASGYPVYRYDVFYKHPETPDRPFYSGDCGPNINQPEIAWCDEIRDYWD
jgi:hypothetical protein